jgi:rhodanese-related sulfurtransferase
LDLGAFLRKPSFQIALVVFTVILVAYLVLIGQPTTKPAQSISITPSPQAKVTGTAVPGVISVSMAYDLYMSNSAYMLDVRERTEWDQSHIPNSTLLPLGQVAGMVDKFPRDKPIIIVSGSDNRSQQGRDILKAAGYNNVTSMAGGIIFWQNQGYPLEP